MLYFVWFVLNHSSILLFFYSLFFCTIFVFYTFLSLFYCIIKERTFGLVSTFLHLPFLFTAPVHAEGQNKPAPNRGNGSKPKQWNKQNNNQHHRPASGGNQVEGHKSNLQPIEDLVGGSTLIANAEDESSNVVTSSSVANPVSSTESIYKHDVVIDTGSSINLTGQGDKLKNIKESKSINVTTINGAGKSTSNRTGILPLNGKYSLDDVAYVPNSTFTLLSVGRLCNGGLQAVFTKHGGAVLKPRTGYSVSVYQEE